MELRSKPQYQFDNALRRSADRGNVLYSQDFTPAYVTSSSFYHSPKKRDSLTQKNQPFPATLRKIQTSSFDESLERAQDKPKKKTSIRVRPNTPKVNLTELRKRRQKQVHEKENIRTQIPTNTGGNANQRKSTDSLVGKGVLFGSAFEDKFFDIIENEEVENETELTEKLLENALDMDVEEMRDL